MPSYFMMPRRWMMSVPIFWMAFIPFLATAAPPNIIMILADDLGYGDLSSYGATDLKSPHIDNLVSHGIKFNNFYANCPVCSPTRASLLTGRYPEWVGVPGVIRTHAENSWGYLAADAILIPEMLQRANYDTAIVGKWHLGLESSNQPNARGFGHFHGFLGDMMDDYYEHRRHGVNYMRKDDREIDPTGHATDLFTRWACEYIRDQAGNDQPFFLYLAYNAPHTPIQPPQDWLDKVKKREPGISDRRASLVALIEHMDDGIGQVIATLDEVELTDDTLVIFSSDNGGQLNAGANNGSLRDGKQSMYEGGLRVPTCVVWPGKIEAGSVTDERGITMDLFSTICDAAGVVIDHDIDGVSLMPTLLGEPVSIPPRDLFFHRREGGTRYGGLIINAVISGDWKLLQNSPFQPQELFRLSADPLEASDLSGSSPRKFSELAAILRLQVQRGGSVPWQPPQRKKD